MTLMNYAHAFFLFKVVVDSSVTSNVIFQKSNKHAFFYFSGKSMIDLWAEPLETVLWVLTLYVEVAGAYILISSLCSDFEPKSYCLIHTRNMEI